MTYSDLKKFFEDKDIQLIMVSDAEPRVDVIVNGKVKESVPAGGVGLSLDPIAKSAGAVFIARAKTPEEKKAPETTYSDSGGSYTLKRLSLKESEFEGYYNGFSNQTLWPLCHVAFERPEFRDDWFEEFRAVNKKFADAIKHEIKKSKKRPFIWINDFQLSLVPSLLDQKEAIIAMFWHIPWPTWEVFRILPYKKEILESILQVDFLAFHRGYHVRNFIDTIDREFEARIDEETNRIFFDKNVTKVTNLPLGIDTAAIKTIASGRQKTTPYDDMFNKYKVIIGVDRLDYIKGLILRLQALDRFLEKHSGYRGRVQYFGIVAPSRVGVPTYQTLKKDLIRLAERINKKYAKGDWEPIKLEYKVFSREDVVNFYKKSSVCLVTPRDDGMNLVSKEFVMASSLTDNPGMLVLSRFAGSAIDLTESLIVNPYDTEEVADAIKTALEMKKEEKVRRLTTMAQTLDDRNIFRWARDFVEGAIEEKRESK